MTEKTRIIILNGIGSVGKSSTAKALQSIANEPFLHVQGDNFLEMMPGRWIGHPEGITFKTEKGAGSPIVSLEMGPALDQVWRGMRRAIAAMATAGNNLIVDDMMMSVADQRDYQDVLGGFDVKFIGLFAPLEVLEQRERDRKDRMIGLARWQYDKVHKGIAYDLKIETSDHDPKTCAEIIRKEFGL